MGDETNPKKRKGCLNPFKRGCFLFVYLPLLAGALIFYGIWYFENKTTSRKRAQVQADLEELTKAVNQYYAVKNHYPDSLDELLEPESFIPEIPIDPFSKAKEPYKYMNLNDGYLVLVYSVGRDGEDNYCNHDDFHVVHPDVEKVDIPLQECLQIERTKDDPDNGMAFFMKAYLKSYYDLHDLNMKNREELDMIADLGWEESIDLIAYAASNDSATHPLEWDEYIKGIKSGYINPDLNLLLQVIDANQDAIDLIHQGAMTSYTKSIFYDQDFSGLTTDIPDFMRLLLLTRVIVINASYSEYINKKELAVEDYLAAIRFAQSCGHFNHEIPRMFDLSMEEIAYQNLLRCLSKNEFSSDYLKSILNKIDLIEKDAPSFHATFLQSMRRSKCVGERMDFATKIENATYYIQFLEDDRKAKVSLPEKIKIYLQTFIRMSESVNKQVDFFQSQADAALLPYKKRILYEYKQTPREDGVDDGVRPSIGAQREVTNWSTAAATKILIALQLYKLKYNTYPDTLEPLTEFLDPVPNDPFTEEPFKYEKSGRGYVLYSIGPELEDNRGEIAYDPTNGSTSPGDLLFH